MGVFLTSCCLTFAAFSRQRRLGSTARRAGSLGRQSRASTSGRPNSSCGKLYLAPGARSFGCRLCCRLTYRSAQEHDKRVGALRRDPDAPAAPVSDPPAASARNLILALKALRRGQA
jgi:hypothetical protein